MPKPELVHKNETHKTLMYFEILMDYLVPAWRPDFGIINERR